MAIQDSTLDQGPWYRQGWAWFLLTPLIVIVLVMAAYISVAVKLSDDVVIDNYYREGRMYNERLEQDHRATALAMRAELDFDLETGEVFLQLSGDELPESLVLVLQHPTEADLDQTVILAATGQGNYRGDLNLGVNFSRYLLLFPGASANERGTAPWRLKDKIDFQASHAVTLQATEKQAADQ